MREDIYYKRLDIDGFQDQNILDTLGNRFCVS